MLRGTVCNDELGNLVNFFMTVLVKIGGDNNKLVNMVLRKRLIFKKLEQILLYHVLKGKSATYANKQTLSEGAAWKRE